MPVAKSLLIFSLFSRIGFSGLASANDAVPTNIQDVAQSLIKVRNILALSADNPLPDAYELLSAISAPGDVGLPQ